jgi:hypothetical protein
LHSYPLFSGYESSNFESLPTELSSAEGIDAEFEYRMLGPERYRAGLIVASRNQPTGSLDKAVH